MQNNYPGVLYAGSWIVPEELFYKQKFIISEYMFSQGPIISNGLLHKQKLVLLIFVCLVFFYFNAIRVFVRRMEEYQGLKKGD